MVDDGAQGAGGRVGARADGALETLRARIRAIETGGRGQRRAGDADARGQAADGLDGQGLAAQLGGLERGVLHEFCGAGDGACWSPPLVLLVELARLELLAERPPHSVAFVGRRVWPHAALLAAPPRVDVRGCVRGDARDELRGAPTRLATAHVTHLARGARPVETGLLAAALFVDTEGVVAPGQRGANASRANDGARVWAADRTLRANVAAAVVIDGSGLALGEVRRLQLAAEAGGALALLARPTRDAGVTSSAASRWLVEPTLDDVCADGGADADDERSDGALVPSLLTRAACVSWRVTELRRRRVGA